MSRVDAAGIAAQTGSGPNGTGTPEPTMEYWIPVESGGGGPSFEEMTADETLGSRFPTDRQVGGIYYEPTMTGKARDTNLPRLLSGFMCDPVSAAVVGSTGAYSHVLNPVGGNLEPRAASILLARNDPVPPIIDLFSDALGNELTLSVEPNDWLSFEATWVARARDGSIMASPSVVADLTPRYPFYSICAYVSIDGGVEEAISLGSFEMSWSSNIDTDAWMLCSRDLFRVAPGNVDLEVSFRPLQDLREWYDRVFLTDPEAIALRLEALGPQIGAGPAVRKIEITLPRIIETEVEGDIDAATTLLGVDVTGQASVDPLSGDFCTVEVVNDVANYTP